MICDKLIDTYRDDGDKEWWSNIFSYEPGFPSFKAANFDGWFLKDLLNISKHITTLSEVPSGLVSVPLILRWPDEIETKGAIVSGIAGIKIDERRHTLSSLRY